MPLLAPVAESLGIDLVWFAVLLAVNMQTSFMHPPFGFALFFLRSVAPKEAYIDKITKKRIEGIKTTEIYWGAVPFIMIQLCMVGVVLAFPGLVTHYKGATPKVDPTTIQIGIDSYGSSYGNDPYASDPFGSSGADPYAADSFDSNSGSDEGIKSGPDAEESNSLQNEHQQTDSRDPYDIGFQ